MAGGESRRPHSEPASAAAEEESDRDDADEEVPDAADLGGEDEEDEPQATRSRPSNVAKAVRYRMRESGRWGGYGEIWRAIMLALRAKCITTALGLATAHLVVSRHMAVQKQRHVFIGCDETSGDCLRADNI